METMRSLSEIPGVLIEQIVSYLTFTEKQAIQLSLLSKDFYKALQNPRGTLKFNHSWNEKGCMEEVETFCSTLKEYHKKNINLESLSFKITGYPSEEDFPNKCINLAMKLSPKNLDLSLLTSIGVGFVPQTVCGAKSVEQLSLKYCNFKKRFLVPWPNLKKLSFDSVDLANGIFEEMVRSSPLLETLQISRSTGLSSSAWNFERALFYNNHCYQNLKVLSIYFADIEDGFFIEFEHKFPRLEHLSIHKNEALENIGIYNHHSLQTIELVDIHNLKEVYVDAPNAVHLVYRNQFGIIPNLLFYRTPRKWSADIKLECNADIDSSWFFKLWNFLAVLTGSEISITVIFKRKVRFNKVHEKSAESTSNVPGIVGEIKESLDSITFQHSIAPAIDGSRATEIYQYVKLLEAHFVCH